MTEPAARCGYSKCRAELPAPGPQGGRRRAFCRDVRWAGDRSCAQMARAERDALDALGLDSGQAAFGLDADRLREHVEAVREPVVALATALDQVTARLAEVESRALAAVETANRATATARSEQAAAVEAAERAVADAQRAAQGAGERAERAERDRAAALERAGAAARQAMEATEALGVAREQAEQAVAARVAERDRADAADSAAAAALAAAHQAELLVSGIGAERDAAVGRAGEWRAELEKVREEVAVARSQAAAARAERDEAAERATRVDGALRDQRAGREVAERERDAARQRVGTEAELRAVLETELERGRTELDRLRAELEHARAGARDELRVLIAAAVHGDRAPDPAR